MTRYTRAMSWMVVGAYIGSILAAVAFGSYLLSWPVTIWSVALMAITSIFIGTRLRGINNIVHECSHATFADDRNDNQLIGRVCTSILMKTFRKYRDDHLSHHANNGDYENDAEFGLIEKFGLHDPVSLRTILRHIVTPLTLRHLPQYTGINLSAEDGRIYVALKLAILAAMAGLLVVSPLTAILFVLVPWFYIYPTLNFWTDCMDHAGLVGADDELEASRNVLAPTPIRLLFFPRNDSYHLVHHLFPQVPARHLHLAHAELCKDPVYRAMPSAAGNTDAKRRPLASAAPS
ncbi:MAG: fatty acid desaturase [Paracoccaceae bacterium]